MTEEREFTVEQVLQAIEKDGLPQARGSWFYSDPKGIKHLDPWAVHDYSEVKSACALGMAAINLDVNLYDLKERLPFAGEIESWNDDDEMSFVEIAERYRQDHYSYLDKTIVVAVARKIEI